MHDDRQGADAEFMSEIQTLAQVTHLSLVKYYGFVVHNDEKILVVEYVANGTLRDHLDCEYTSYYYLLFVYIHFKLIDQCESVCR